MDLERDPNPTTEPLLSDIMRELQRIHRRLDQQEHRLQRSTPRHRSDRDRDKNPPYRQRRPTPKVHDVKKFDSTTVPAATPTPAENFIIVIPEGTAIGVEEENGPIWDKDLTLEPQPHEERSSFIDEYLHIQFANPTIELFGGPRFDPEYIDEMVPKEPYKVVCDVIPCMILPPDPPKYTGGIRTLLLQMKTKENKDLPPDVGSDPVILAKPLPPQENDPEVFPVEPVQAWTDWGPPVPAQSRLSAESGPFWGRLGSQFRAPSWASGTQLSRSHHGA